MRSTNSSQKEVIMTLTQLHHALFWAKQRGCFDGLSKSDKNNPPLKIIQEFLTDGPESVAKEITYHAKKI